MRMGTAPIAIDPIDGAVAAAVLRPRRRGPVSDKIFHWRVSVDRGIPRCTNKYGNVTHMFTFGQDSFFVAHHFREHDVIIRG